MTLAEFFAPLTSTSVTSPFGNRNAPKSGASTSHKGVDYRAAVGTPVRAAAGGTVSFAGQQSGYGNIVLIDHPGGAQTAYAHLSGFAVSPGQSVAAGQTIASSGATGNVTGPHLHFELRLNGQAVDPAPLLSSGALPVVDAPVIDYSSFPDFSGDDQGTVIDEYGLPTFSVDATGFLDEVGESVGELGAAVGVNQAAMFALLALVGFGVLWSLSPSRDARASVPALE